jgi:hypothetical protein
VGNNSIGGIAFNVNLAPGQSVKIPIVVAWDIPIAKPGTGAMWYREYTRTYGQTGLNSFAIANDALNNYSTWETSINSWQNTILTGPYPTWLQQMLFNELYYYFIGGTMWEAGQVGSTTYNAGPDMFSSLESYIYELLRNLGRSVLWFLGLGATVAQHRQAGSGAVLRQRGGQQFPLPRPAAIGTCAHDFGDREGIVLNNGTPTPTGIARFGGI